MGKLVVSLDGVVIKEVQITKEYLGFATHLVYLGPLYEEVLRADTRTRGKGATVAQSLAGMAGVANIGTDRTWSGSHFDQANWYAFGRLAWNPGQSAADIAAELAHGDEGVFAHAPTDVNVGGLLLPDRGLEADERVAAALADPEQKGRRDVEETGLLLADDDLDAEASLGVDGVRHGPRGPCCGPAAPAPRPSTPPVPGTGWNIPASRRHAPARRRAKYQPRGRAPR